MGGRRSYGLFSSDNTQPMQLTSTTTNSNHSHYYLKGYGTTASPTVTSNASHHSRSADNECTQWENRPNQQSLGAGERPILRRAVAGVAALLFGAAALSAMFNGWGSRHAAGASGTGLGEVSKTRRAFEFVREGTIERSPRPGYIASWFGRSQSSSSYFCCYFLNITQRIHLYLRKQSKTDWQMNPWRQ